MVVVLLLLISNEYIKNVQFRNEPEWDRYYARAVMQDRNQWRLGWRLEDLGMQVITQKEQLSELLRALETVRPLATRAVQADEKRPDEKEGGGVAKAEEDGEGKSVEDGSGIMVGGLRKTKPEVSRMVAVSKLLTVWENANHMFKVECATRPDKYLQVGVHSMVVLSESCCQVYSAAESPVGPNAIFEKVDMGKGRFALKAFSTGRYLRVVPPLLWDPQDKWELEVGSPVVGLPEIFRFREGMIYNDIMKGYISCSGERKQEKVVGIAGDHIWQDPDNHRIRLIKVSNEELERARTLRGMSKSVQHRQQEAINNYLAEAKGKKNQGAEDSEGVEKEEITTGRIAVCVPMTSTGTAAFFLDQSPLFSVTFDSFLESVDWRRNRFRFDWYLGFDRGDSLYDADGAWFAMEKKFWEVAKEVLARMDLPVDEVKTVLKERLSLTLQHFDDTQGAPSRVVSKLIVQAHLDGADYMYQINDDTYLTTPRWAETFATILHNNPLGRNVGVTGPVDTNNRKILTHAFVHRTHVDIFGNFFPESFRNWWSDDWISSVYGANHTFRDHFVTITHDIETHKLDTTQRYQIDFAAQYFLVNELKRGHVTLNKWLEGQGLPQLALPVVCGYSPLVEEVYTALELKFEKEKKPTYPLDSVEMRHRVAAARDMMMERARNEAQKREKLAQASKGARAVFQLLARKNASANIKSDAATVEENEQKEDSNLNLDADSPDSFLGLETYFIDLEELAVAKARMEEEVDFRMQSLEPLSDSLAREEQILFEEEGQFRPARKLDDDAAGVDDVEDAV
ncbi:unnamed protein product [Discosporangium mesarthrocarpum]